MPDLEQKLGNKTAVIGIAGLGYVGLPLAVAFAAAGYCRRYYWFVITEGLRPILGFAYPLIRKVLRK
jgi:hypothetical protein